MPVPTQHPRITPRRFWLFAFHRWPDATGGMGDLYGTYDKADEAKEDIKLAQGNTFQIVDTVTGVINEYC